MTAIFDLTKQLAFYGAYHSNKINVLIHMLCVPLLIWSMQVMTSGIPIPSFGPQIHHQFNEYLIFDLNFSAIGISLFCLYYLALEPVAALLYVPQMVLSTLTATAFSYRSDAMAKAGALHAICWVAQFLGHGLAEKRAPALMDNLFAAVVLAPFFVHLEILFSLGYNPGLHKQVQNGIGQEIARVRKLEAIKKRAVGKKQ